VRPHDADTDRTRWSQAPVVARRVHDGVLLLPIDGESDEPTLCFGTGAAIWDALAVPGSVDDVARRLSRTFAAPADEIAADVRRTVALLEAACTLHEHEGSPAAPSSPTDPAAEPA
jgi:hypothetical protein